MMHPWSASLWPHTPRAGVLGAGNAVTQSMLVSVVLSPCGLEHGSFCFVSVHRDDREEGINARQREEAAEFHVTTGKLMLRSPMSLNSLLDKARNL